jgi:acetyl coenzyme A synthetase (ADP forming)-like protein
LGEHSLKGFFEASSIALIGASEDPKKVGHQILKNVLTAGYKGRIYPVNPKASKILGLIAYSSVEEIPSQVDLAVVAVPAAIVPSVLTSCARKKIKDVIIVSGGFREVGEQGKKLEEELIDIVKVTGIRVIGPNCQGLNNPHIGLCATWAAFSNRPGPIGIITQSGSVGGAIQFWADKEGIGVSKCVNLGNKIDVNEIDLLRYMKDDPSTKAIALYLEGVSDGRAFMSTGAEVARIKPVVALKTGTTKAGTKAMLSHTSSLAGRAEIFAAAFKQAGIVRATNLEELYDIAKAFSFLPLPRGPGVLIIESSGGFGIMAADMCEKLGLLLPEPDETAKARLRNVLPSTCTFSNPFDLTTESFDADRFRLVIEENKRNEDFHAFIAIFGDPIVGAAEAIKKASETTEKPIIVVYEGGGQVEDDERARMHSMGIPVFPSPERAVTALHALLQYSKLISNQTYMRTNVNRI